jgi:hypothetical protein
MTDRIHSLTVVLADDIRIDDAGPLIEAIKQFRGVISVQGDVVDPSDHIARARVSARLYDAIMSVFREN